MQAGQFIEVIEDWQGLKIGCIEEVVYECGFIDVEQLECLGYKYFKSGYGEYLFNLLKQQEGQLKSVLNFVGVIFWSLWLVGLMMFWYFLCFGLIVRCFVVVW